MAKKKLSFEKREEMKKKMLAFRAEAEEGNENNFIRMTESERFKIGQHWDSDDQSFNEAHGKFSLTVNEVLPIVLDIAGTQEENPLDWKARNVKGGTQTIAEILTALMKNVMDKSLGRSVASRGFESGVTTGRGFIHIDIDYTNDPLNGDFTIKELDPFMVLPDPTCKEYDYNEEKGGAKYIIIDRWEDKEKMEAKYPDRNLKDASFRAIPQGRFGSIITAMFGGGGPDLDLKDDYRHRDEGSFKDEMESNTSKQTNNYRVSTYWWKEWKKGVYLQRVDDPLNYLAMTDTKDISNAKKIAESNPEEFRIVDKDRNELPLTIPILNKTIMIGDKFLEHIPDPFDGMNLYLTTRFAPYFDHGYEYSPIQNLIGPQKLINYTFSTLVNILKNLANTGWITGKCTEAAKEVLEDSGGEDGVVFDKTKYGGFLQKIETTSFPTGFDITTERGKQNMREISQVQLTVPKGGNPESGKAKQIDELRTQRTKGIIFRNWNQTNILLAKVLTELIRNTEVFSDDEIMAIVDEDDLIDAKILDQAKGIIINQLKETGAVIPEKPEAPNQIRMANAPPELQAQMLESFTAETKTFRKFIEQVEQAAIPIAKDIILKLLRQMQQGRYGIKVDTSPHAPTLRMVRSLELQTLHKSLIESGQPGVSRNQLIDATDAPNKEEIKAEVPAEQGAA